MTLLCVPIMVEDADRALADAREAKSLGAAVVEFRIDQIFHGDGDDFGAGQAVRLAAESPLPCIITCRAASEGGFYDWDDSARVSLYERLGAMDVPPRYLDIELAAYTRSANLKQKVNLAVDHPGQGRDLSTGLILSAHDFNGRPQDLSRIVASMRSEPAAKVDKIAFRCRSLRDNIELFELLRDRHRPMIALGMGEFGLMSRVLAPKFGGFLTFASLRDAAATAPGQPTIQELRSLYRFDSIGAATRVYGVIGWPVGHSLSPKVHNAGFGQVGHDGVYLPLPVPPEWEHFKATLGALLDFAPLDFRGASVTLPHKEHLVRFAREDRTRRWEIDPLAERCGAANTLVVREDGSCRVMNTDAPAAVASLAAGMGGSVAGRRVGVVGAGGVARAVVAGLVEAGATAVVYGRTQERVERLVGEVMAQPVVGGGTGKAVAGVWEKLCGSCCEAFVNCTPVGMKDGPDPESSPLPIEELNKSGNLARGTPVLDTVYTPLETPMLRLARQHELNPIPGWDMFVRQAVMQFETWTGAGGRVDMGNAAASTAAAGARSVTIQLFERIVKESLAPASPG